MKSPSFTEQLRKSGYGELRSFVTEIRDEVGPCYLGHIYTAGDDDTSHNVIKSRTIKKLYKKMKAGVGR